MAVNIPQSPDICLAEILDVVNYSAARVKKIFRTRRKEIAASDRSGSVTAKDHG